MTPAELDRQWLQDLKRRDRQAYYRALDGSTALQELREAEQGHLGPPVADDDREDGDEGARPLPEADQQDAAEKVVREEEAGEPIVVEDLAERLDCPDHAPTRCDDLGCPGGGEGGLVDAAHAIDGEWVSEDLHLPVRLLPGTSGWHARRAKVIGGSDAAACVSLAPESWEKATPWDIYSDKRGELERRPPSMAMRRGTALEPVILARYEELTGRTLLAPFGMLRHPVHRFMGANLDGLTADLRLVEAKSCDWPHLWGAEGTDQIPIYYSIQVQHCLCILLALFPDADREADVPVWISGEQDIRVYHVEADPDLHAMLVEAEGYLWGRIEAGDPPPPSTGLEVVRRYDVSAPDTTVMASAEDIASWSRILAIDLEVKKRKREREGLVDELKVRMTDAEALADDDGRLLATWRTSAAGSRIDTAAMETDHPEIVDQYRRTNRPGRPFLVKPGKIKKGKR